MDVNFEYLVIIIILEKYREISVVRTNLILVK